jgi:hypothetical protein
MMKIVRGRLTLNPFQDGIREVVSDRDGKRKLVNRRRREKKIILLERAEIRHAKKGTSHW